MTICKSDDTEFFLIKMLRLFSRPYNMFMSRCTNGRLSNLIDVLEMNNISSCWIRSCTSGLLNLGIVRVLLKNTSISSIMDSLAKPKLITAWKNGSMANEFEELFDSDTCRKSPKHTSYGKTGMLFSNTSMVFCSYYVAIVSTFFMMLCFLLTSMLALRSSSLRMSAWLIITILIYNS
jgi:hypothetical protein